MTNKNILENIDKILSLANYNLKKNSFAIRENAGIKYLKEAGEEVKETLEEYKKDNKVYLEDEFGDIFWDWVQALKIAERDGMIESVEKVFEHSLNKYSQRLEILEDEDFLKEVEDGGLDTVPTQWTGVKNKQKKELKKRHQELYGEEK